MFVISNVNWFTRNIRGKTKHISTALFSILSIGQNGLEKQREIKI